MSEPQAAPARSDALPSRLFNRYDVQRELGRGGMGIVYQCVDSELRRPVALKLLPSAADPELLARFEREARLVARLSRPHIVPLLDFGHDGATPFFTMPLIDGPSLFAARRDRGADFRLFARALADAADALDYAHSQGILHRDVKPGNILLDSRDTAFLADFGLARPTGADVTRLTLSGSVLGTPAYMAPEQAKAAPDQPLDARADVFSLGSTLYFLLTGCDPFTGKTPYEVIDAVVQQEPVRPRALEPKAPAELEMICLKAMEKEPARRYATAAELAADLRRWLAGEAVTAKAPTLAYRLRRKVRRNPWAWGLGAAAVVAIATGAVALALQSGRSARREEAHRIYQEAQTAYHGAVEAAISGNPDGAAMIAAFESKIEEARRVDPGFDLGWFELAQYRRIIGDEEGAKRCLEEGFRRRPEHPLGRLERGMLAAAEYTRLQERTRAEITAEIYEHPAPSGWRITTDVLEEREPRMADLRQRAVEDIEAGVSALTGGEPTWVKLALANLDALQQRWEAAEARLIPLGNAAAKVLLAQVRTGRGDLPGAEEAYTAALAIRPDDWDAVEGRARMRMVRAGEEAGFEEIRSRLEEALSDWTRAAEGRPQSAGARLGKAEAEWRLGYALQVRGRDPTALYERAIAAATAAAAADPLDRRAQFNLVNAYAYLAGWQADHGLDPTDSFRLAIEACEARMRLGVGSPDVLVSQGNIWQALGDWRRGRQEDSEDAYHRAVESYDEALARGASGATPHNNRGNALVGWAGGTVLAGEDPTDRFREAVLSFDRAISIEPRNAAAFNNRGNAYKGIAEWLHSHHEGPLRHEEIEDLYRQAINSFASAAEIDPAVDGYWGSRAAAFQCLGEWELHVGADPTDTFRRAFEDYDRALALNRDNWTTWTNRGTAFKILGRWSDALDSWEHAYRIVGDGYPPLRTWIEEARDRTAPEY